MMTSAKKTLLEQIYKELFANIEKHEEFDEGMKKMNLRYKTNLIVILGTVLLTSSVSYPNVVGVPLVGKMIRQADVIVSGTISLNDVNEPELSISKFFKGELDNKGNIPLKLKETIPFFSLEYFLKPIQGKQVIVLGDFDESDKKLVLTWAASSVWPYGRKGQTEIQFLATNYQECEDFLVNYLSYQETGEKDKNLLIEKLLDDIHSSEKRSAVLSYCNEMLSEVMGNEESRKQVITALLAEIITNKYYDLCTVNNVGYLPSIPRSIGATYMLDVARQKENKRSEYAFIRARVLLGIRKEEVKDLSQLELIMEDKFEKLRISDAKTLLNTYESENQYIRSYAGKIMKLIFSDIKEPDISIEDTKVFWQERYRKKKN